MPKRRAKPTKPSPASKHQEERLRQCAETTEWSRRIIETSKKLIAESRELIENIQKHHATPG